MLIRDYSGYGFGMMGHDTGRDCPVPSGMFPTDAEKAAWCDCAYADPVLNKKCKVNYEAGRPIALMAAPWTTAPLCGAAARGLPLNNGGILCDAVKLISEEVNKLVQSGLNTVTTGGGTTGTQPGTTQTQPNVTQTQPPNVQPGRFRVTDPRIARLYEERRGQPIKGELPYTPPGSDYTPPAYRPPVVTSSSMGGMGLVVALAAGAFLLPRLLKPKSGPALSGYSRRRRRR